MKKSTILIIALISSLNMVLTQTVTVGTYGISPNGVAADGEDIFDRAYSGMQNVGVETQMYLKGVVGGGELTDPTWTVLWAPFGSTAGFGTTADLETTTQVVRFTPDMVGVYYIQFSDLGASATLTVHAGSYIGMDSNNSGDLYAFGNCGGCHPGKVDEWSGTGHSDMLVRGLNGTLSDHYSGNCISCHTTGYDAIANNGGFDEYGFVYPDSTTLVDVYGSPDGHLFDGLYDLMAADYPDAFQKANIQCESCHGPGSDHFGNTSDYRMQASLITENCAWCHDSGTHHVFPTQWAISGHANPPDRPTWNSGCARCHTPEGFIEYAEGQEIAAHGTSPFSCAMCHDPHSAETPHQIRLAETPLELSNGFMVTEGGLGKLCMNCHMTRRDADTYTNQSGSHYGPHYGVQADMLNATNAVTFGQTLPTSPHLTATENSCITCHMWAANGKTDENGEIYMVGGHTFEVHDASGADNVTVCAPCHGEIESFESKMYWQNGVADHDGDGMNEGLQAEVEGLMEIIAEMLPHADTTSAWDHENPDNTWTLTELKAAYNVLYVYYDKSEGIHNPAFAVSLLQTSILALENSVVDGQIVGIEDIPNDQGRQVKVIWDKFLGDGVAFDPINIYSLKRYDAYDSTWTNVGTLPADGSNRYAFVAPTLYDSTSVNDGITTFKVLAISNAGIVYQSNPADGYSIDNLAPAIPTGVMAYSDLGTIELVWNDPEDADFNYFAIYRNGDVIGYSTEAGYVDQVDQGGEYVYTILATDINENVSDPSTPETVLAGILGDPTGDFQIDVLDVVMQVSIIMGIIAEPTLFQLWAGDTNEDGAIDVLDVVMNVSTIMGTGLSRGNMITTSDVAFGNNSIMIATDGNMAGFQLTLNGEFSLAGTDLPSGWEIHSNTNTILAFNMSGQVETQSATLQLDGEFVIETALITDWYENGILAELVMVPEEYNLSNAYPNPFNPTTTIEYGLPFGSNVRIMVYDMLGRQVAELVNSYQNAGIKKITWMANDMPSGIYIVKMTAGSFEKTQKVMLVK